MDGITSSFYNDDVTVFTPKGEAVILPKDATALDFAFEIHSLLGEHAKYARVNGRLCSVKTVLSSGDCVEIFSSDDVVPSPSWLDHVMTYKAKAHLHSVLSRQKKIPYIRCCNCNPLPGDEVIGFKGEDEGITLHRRDCKSAIRLASQKGDDIVAVNFEEDKDFLFPVNIVVTAVDRYHLLIDLVDCITNRLKLSLNKIKSDTVDEIVTCSMNFSVHSCKELQEAIAGISAIESVEEVKHIVD